MMSSFKTCQKALMNLKLNPPEPGLLALSHSHIVSFTSSSPNLSTKPTLSICVIWLKCTPSRSGLSQHSSLNLLWKNLLASFFTFNGSSTHSSSKKSPLIKFFLPFQLTMEWKNLELWSPSKSHLLLAFCFANDSIQKVALQKVLVILSFYAPLHHLICLSLFLSSSLISSNSFCFCCRLPNSFLFHIFNKFFNFSLRK